MERIWALGYLKGSNKVVLGYDEGCVMIKVSLRSSLDRHFLLILCVTQAW